MATSSPLKVSQEELKARDFASSPFQAEAHASHHTNEELDKDYKGSYSDTASHSSDEFDWEAEDESVTKEATVSQKVKRGRKAWQLFLRLARPLRILLLAIVGGCILITPYLVVRLRIRSSNEAFVQVRAWSIWLTVSWGVGCCTSILVTLLPRLVLNVVLAAHGKPPESLTGRLELLTAVSGWLTLCLNVSWTWVALSVMTTILQPPGDYWVIINRVMQALFSAAIILLAEKIFLQYVAIKFHRKALADRIAENRIGLKALDRLASAQTPTKKAGGRRKKGKLTPQNLSRSGSPDSDHPTPRIPSTPNEKELHPSTRRQEKKEEKRKKRLLKNAIINQLGEAIGQIALKDSKLNRQADIGSLWSARRLARKLFVALNAVEPDRDHLVVEDFYPYFPTQAEAITAFAIFDKDNNGDLTKTEMREAVQRIYRERRALIASLKDVSSAVAKLDAVLIFSALLVIAFIALLIFNRTSTVESLVPLATIVLGFSFIFGHSAQLLFESLIFIFSTHVFDVGDLVMIDDQILLVKEFGLFSTTFRRVDGQEIIAPNTVLASSKLIHNLRRSNSMWETTDLTIAYDTPLEVIEQLKVKLQAYIASNNREWNNVWVNIDKMEYQNTICLKIAMEHKANWQDWGGRWARRTAFMRNLKTVLEELEIGYSLPLQPVYVDPPSWGTIRSTLTTAEDLGNAGTHSTGDMNRAPGPVIRISSDAF